MNKEVQNFFELDLFARHYNNSFFTDIFLIGKFIFISYCDFFCYDSMLLEVIKKEKDLKRSEILYLYT